MKSVLSTKGKCLRVGKKPDFGVWKFIVMFCFGTEAPTQYFCCCGLSNVKLLRSLKAEVFAEKTDLASLFYTEVLLENSNTTCRCWQRGLQEVYFVVTRR